VQHQTQRIVVTGAQRQRLEFKPISPIAALAWCPDDTALAIGNADGRVALWETAG
jgi:hypothetical protein